MRRIKLLPRKLTHLTTSLDINKINDEVFNDSSAIILSNGLHNELTSFSFRSNESEVTQLGIRSIFRSVAY